MYFVALEALANCHKHAPGARVTITLRRDRTMLFLEVRDNGPGFEVQRRHSDSGNGMLNMADRMAAVGGDVGVESRPGVGTWVTTRAPAMARVTSLVTGEQSSAEG